MGCKPTRSIAIFPVVTYIDKCLVGIYTMFLLSIYGVFMKKIVIFLSIFLISSTLWAQQKFALVIGNNNYNGITPLKNPVNDANDMEAALKNLGFSVEKILDGNLEQMETGVNNLKRRLGSSRNTYGFFFYAGHGVQANGENYLIPTEANNIYNETNLRQRAVSLQFIMDSLNEAGNELNMIVLDACRDNPFGWSRSGSRGLSVISQAPTGSVVMYATSANSVANDGTGRNGLFTAQLLHNLTTDGLSVFQIFDNTMNDVINVSNGRQHPELSLKFPGSASTYLGSRPNIIAQPEPVETPVSLPVQPVPLPETSNDNADRFSLDGKRVFAVSGTGMVGVGYSGGATVTFYEKYNANSKMTPSFFLTAKWVGINYDPSKVYDEANCSFFAGGAGILLKFRPRRQERLLINTGFSLEYFLGSVEVIGNIYFYAYKEDVKKLGMGIQFIGVSYRIHPHISLDMNATGKISFSTVANKYDDWIWLPAVGGVEMGITFMLPY